MFIELVEPKSAFGVVPAGDCIKDGSYAVFVEQETEGVVLESEFSFSIFFIVS